MLSLVRPKMRALFVASTLIAVFLVIYVQQGSTNAVSAQVGAPAGSNGIYQKQSEKSQVKVTEKQYVNKVQTNKDKVHPESSPNSFRNVDGNPLTPPPIPAAPYGTEQPDRFVSEMNKHHHNLKTYGKFEKPKSTKVDDNEVAEDEQGVQPIDAKNPAPVDANSDLKPDKEQNDPDKTQKRPLTGKNEKYALDKPQDTRLSADGDTSLLAAMKEQLDVLTRKMQSLETELHHSNKSYPKTKRLNYADRRRILVTGGGGFVGSHLVDELMRKGHEVTALDNFFTGRKRNIEQWIGHPNFEFVHHDIVNPIYFEVDRIYHLASPASPPHYMYNPVKTIKSNTLGTINMLGMARRSKARILFASTSEVYGDPEVHPQPESYWGHVNPIGPRACYDESKRIAETLMYAYQKQEKVDIRISRIFNTFGPRMHMNDGRVVSNFILQALQDKPITIYGSGNQTRSFQYVSDLVNGMILLMESNYTQPVNLGNPIENKIMDFADRIKIMTNSNSEIINVAAATDDPRRRKPDISLAKKVLNWEPLVELDVGLQRTIDYFRDELTKERPSSERRSEL